MSTLRPYLPLLVAIVLLLLAVGLFMIRMAGFGKDIEKASKSKNRTGRR